jgi:hypothetical protein
LSSVIACLDGHQTGVQGEVQHIQRIIVAARALLGRD